MQNADRFWLALFAVCCVTTGDAKIDPKTVVGIWLFDESIVDDVAMFSDALSEADIETIMEDGVGKVLGVAPVEPMDKLAKTWVYLKTR